MSDDATIVFVVDDDVSVRESLHALIRAAGWQAETFASAREFLSRPRPLGASCLVLDVRLPDLNGLDLQKRIARDRMDMPIIIITGHADVPMTVQAMKAGAVEFLTKPLRGAVLLDAIRNAIETSHAALRRDGQRRVSQDGARGEPPPAREGIEASSTFEEIVGPSEGLRRVLTQVAKVARTDSTVLILGETGTGKELIAHAIHTRSPRANRAFVRVNCAAIPPPLVASELFGHEKGAFTGAMQRRMGRFELADSGTIFLDEIGDLPAETQIALLRVLQEREIERVGSSRPIPVDVRVLAATHRDLKAAVAAGSFREDLFYRLNVVPIHIPPLRERQDDISPLVEYLVQRYARKAGKQIASIDAKALDVLRAYEWPGNVRELQNVVERAVITCDGDTLVVDEAWFRREAKAKEVASPPTSLPDTIAESERECIEAALATSRGRVSGPNGAATKLGMPRQTLDSKIRVLHIDKYRFRSR
jgi:formate hydrogenlyase transcriptional activator